MVDLNIFFEQENEPGNIETQSRSFFSELQDWDSQHQYLQKVGYVEIAVKKEIPCNSLGLALFKEHDELTSPCVLVF